MREYHFVDGEPVAGGFQKIMAGDAGLLYGCSLFETMLVKGSRPVLLAEHLARMAASARDLGMPLPASPADLAGMCLAAAQRAGTGVLRLTVTAGGDAGKKGRIFIMMREGLPYRAEQKAKGFALLTLDFPRNEKSPLVRHKTANFWENRLGRGRAQQQGYDEGLFLNTRGYVAEGTVSNIFAVRDGELLTPPVEAGLLPGTVRRLVIDYAASAGLACREAMLTRQELGGADELFVTNSLLGVMPVTVLDGAPVGTGTPGAVTRELMRLYPAED